MKKFKITYITTCFVIAYKIVEAVCKEMALIIFQNKNSYSKIQKIEEENK